MKRSEWQQVQRVMHSLEQLLPGEQQARVLWPSVFKLDLSAFYADIQAVEGSRGRDAVDPRILLCP